MIYFKRITTDEDDYILKFNLQTNNDEDVESVFNDIMARNILDLIRNSRQKAHVSDDELSWMEYPLYVRLVTSLGIERPPIKVDTNNVDDSPLSLEEQKLGFEFIGRGTLTYYANLRAGKNITIQEQTLNRSVEDEQSPRETVQEDTLIIPSEDIRHRELQFVLKQLSICTEQKDSKGLLYFSGRLIELKKAKIMSEKPKTNDQDENYEDNLRDFRAQLEEAQNIGDYESAAYYKQRIDLIEKEMGQKGKI